MSTIVYCLLLFIILLLFCVFLNYWQVHYYYWRTYHVCILYILISFLYVNLIFSCKNINNCWPYNFLKCWLIVILCKTLIWSYLDCFVNTIICGVPVFQKKTYWLLSCIMQLSIPLFTNRSMWVVRSPQSLKVSVFSVSTLKQKFFFSLNFEFFFKFVHVRLFLH